MNFWSWLFYGFQSTVDQKSHVPNVPPKAGYKNLLNRKLLIHATVAVVFAYISRDIDQKDIARAILIPLVTILIGVLYTFGTAFHDLLQDETVLEIMCKHSNGIREYSYNYQLSILLILTTIAYWSVCGLGIITQPTLRCYANETGFLLLSASIYSVWSFIAIIQEFLIKKHEIKAKRKEVRIANPTRCPLRRPPQRPAPPAGWRPGAHGNSRPRPCRAPGRHAPAPRLRP